jgi:hypothetical protein
VSKLLAVIGITVGGWIGWAAGARFSFFAAFILGVIGTALGLYAARRIANDHF